ncbi:hypothetical protein DMH04_55675 [Kibdelosporangium aridum]|uniref:Uncharacterized protein n=1 Tax=Kibdelosporangium aridum TaxID=2030 RepID=A0A428XWP0_KIBAR|nr:hypothetical protein [Kibdelosporangium aridum]RSM59632.1 hypothetical protein DMH04_55675 [Kibdelosporangium aridum]
MNKTRKHETLKYLDNRLPFTWRGAIAAFAAVSLLFVGIRSLASGDMHSGWWLLLFGVLATVSAIWFFHSARELRRMEKADRS